MQHPDAIVTFACLAGIGVLMAYMAVPAWPGRVPAPDPCGCRFAAHRHATPEGAGFCREMEQYRIA